MSEQTTPKIKEIITQVVAGVIIAGMIGISGGVWREHEILTTMVLEVETLKQSVARHEGLIEKDVKRLESVGTIVTQKTEDHERRLARLESILDSIRHDIGEMKQDVKILLRGLPNS